MRRVAVAFAASIVVLTLTTAQASATPTPASGQVWHQNSARHLPLARGRRATIVDALCDQRRRE